MTATHTRTQHTPGPWDAARGPLVSEVHANGRVLASIYSRDDARLIAAAPDLLAALEALIRITDGLDNLAQDWADELDAADAAIRKARGEE